MQPKMESEKKALIQAEILPPNPNVKAYPPQPGQKYIVKAFGPEPTYLTCPNCYCNIRTRIESRSTAKTHLIALLCFMMCFLPCLPCIYCTDGCRAIEHYCPKCNEYLGKYDN
ncbi:hypothetical protein QAD02_023976 [Eretmocerus hayati]|uniref:Uncharacterized protein n=1 Tax=Eretmocerus hayati TaxID=131215 RepID=A0ACC2PZK2_9HYME|nr:hypothetical protein QAD02_023976 [Eretmocerus hayati]